MHVVFVCSEVLFLQANAAGSTKLKTAQGVLPILARPEVGEWKWQLPNNFFLQKLFFYKNLNFFCTFEIFTVDKLKTEDDGAGATGETGQPEKKPRKSRWSTNKSFVPGMPTILPSNLSDDQRQAYLRKDLFFSCYCFLHYVLKLILKIFETFRYTRDCVDW